METEAIFQVLKAFFEHGIMGATTVTALLFAWHKDKQVTALNNKVFDMLRFVTQTIDYNKEESNNEGTDTRPKARTKPITGEHLSTGRRADPKDADQESEVPDQKEAD